MTPFKKGDVVIRTGPSYLGLEHGSSYIIHSDDPSSTSGNGSVRVFIEGKVFTHTLDRDYFKLDTSVQKVPFKVGDVVEHTNGIYRTGVVHSFIEDGKRFYFEDKNKNKSAFPYKTHEFKLVAEVEDTNSNNDGCVSDTCITPGDYVRRTGTSYQEVREGYLYKVYDLDKDGDLKLIIDGQPSTYCYRANLFAKTNEVGYINLHGTSCPPTLIVGDARSVGATGDSNSSNPITPMSKTFNEYAVEAFMSNEENRTAATNARNVLQTLVDNLDLSMAAIEKIKRVVYRDFRDLNGAMEDSDIETIAKLVAENPAVKEFVERFMENTLVEILPEPVVTSTSIQDKFK